MKVGYIVEGFNDEAAVLRIRPDAKIAVTKGTRYNRRARMDIEKVIKECDVIFILTDPDEPGRELAYFIQEQYLLPRIIVDPEQAICYRNGRKKIGIEHCDSDYLDKVLTDALLGVE